MMTSDGEVSDDFFPSMNRSAINHLASKITYEGKISRENNKAIWLLKAISLIDLTTLSGDDTACNVRRLCRKASAPLSPKWLTMIFENLEIKPFPLTTAAVCVYPSRVTDAVEALIDSLESTNSTDAEKISSDLKPLPVAAVATGFPSGLYSIESRLLEIEYAIKCGASEIDIVIDRSLVLTGKWNVLYEELCKMRTACKDVHMKCILGVGELDTLDNVYKASMVAIDAGADFIKTSTGKEAVNATIPVGIVMCRAIRNHYMKTGKKVGLKPAGGIRTWKDALNWLILIKQELGDEWLDPSLFRIGASGLLGDIEQWFHEYLFKEKLFPNTYSFI